MQMESIPGGDFSLASTHQVDPPGCILDEGGNECPGWPDEKCREPPVQLFEPPTVPDMQHSKFRPPAGCPQAEFSWTAAALAVVEMRRQWRATLWHSLVSFKPPVVKFPAISWDIEIS